MWLLVRIDDGWDLVIIGGHDTEQNCHAELGRSLWGSRVLCVPAKQRPMLWSEDIAAEYSTASPVPGADLSQ